MTAEPHITDRGFKHYEPVTTTYGHEVKVYESSAAGAPHLWLAIDAAASIIRDESGELCAHLTLDQAREVRDRLDAAIRGHYQLDASRP